MNHRVFTDCTEKQAAEPYETKHDNTNKPRGDNDLAALFMMIHDNKYPNNVVISVSYREYHPTLLLGYNHVMY